MSKQTFADGVGSISIHDGVARIDLITMVPSQEGDGELVPVFKKRILMSLPALLRSHAGLSDVMDQLQEQGAIQKAPGAQATKKAQPGKIIKGSQVQTGSKKVASPNFPSVKKKQ